MQLVLPTRLPADPHAAGREWLLQYLASRPGWHSAADLCRAHGSEPTEDGKRHLRAIASGCAELLSGQKGYRHIDHADMSEIHHAANWLESQARQMLTRAARLRRAGHRRLA